VRERLDCSMLVVEHDMPLLMGLCDRMYAMESGRIIAEGTPEDIRNDPAVVASYLGTDESAVSRSGASVRQARSRPRTKPIAVPAATEPVLRADDLTFSYGRLQVLFGVSLEVRPGEALALLGTNGAGKSTVLRLCAGLDAPAEGSVHLDGDDVTGRSAEHLVRDGMVLISGGKAVFPDMTVDENLDIQALTLGSVALASDRKEAVCARFPRLAERRSQLAGSLSGGEQQQLALGKALVLDPKVLCIDELSLGLSPAIVGELLELVRSIHDSGVSIVLVEQSLNIAAQLCERAVFLEKGEVRFEGPTADLLERDDIARAVFLGSA
jgi:ABC-type branched-subunit amino acid transport system ATPase component